MGHWVPGLSSGKSSSGKHHPWGVLWRTYEHTLAAEPGRTCGNQPCKGGKAACRGRGSEGGGGTEQVYLGGGGVELRREAGPPLPPCGRAALFTPKRLGSQWSSSAGRG